MHMFKALRRYWNWQDRWPSVPYDLACCTGLTLTSPRQHITPHAWPSVRLCHYGEGGSPRRVGQAMDRAEHRFPAGLRHQNPGLPEGGVTNHRTRDSWELYCPEHKGGCWLLADRRLGCCQLRKIPGFLCVIASATGVSRHSHHWVPTGVE